MHIGYAEVGINFVSDYELQEVLESVGEGQREYGCYFSRDNTIYIYEGLTRLQMADTFLHECMHAHVHINGLKFAEMNESKAEEKAVNSISSATVQLWKRNPAAKKWWVSLLK
jgi:hypothetical protein